MVAPATTPAADGLKDCAHCGTPFRVAARPESAYCCEGCAFVARLIRQEGFGQYYELKDRTTSPIKPAALAPRDYAWLEKLAAEAEAGVAPGKPVRLVLDLQGISCIGCVWLLERLFQRHPGGQRLEINAQTGQVRVQWAKNEKRGQVLGVRDQGEAMATPLSTASSANPQSLKPNPSFNILAWAEEAQQFGYLVGPPGRKTQAVSRGLAGRIGLCGAFAANTMLFTLPRYFGMEADFALANLFALLAGFGATLSLLVGGSYFIVRAWRALQAGALHLDFPIALGVVLAYLGSVGGALAGDERFVYFDFVSVFIFLMLCGRWAQEWALERNRNQLLERQSTPETATVVGTGEAREEPVEAVKAGQTIAVVAGALVPLGGTLATPAATLSLEWINGESEPVTFTRGQLIPAGAINLQQARLEIEVTEPWAGSLLERLVATGERAFRPRRLEKILRIYLWAVLALALLGFGGWALAGQVLTGLQVLLSVLVVSCPCALGVAYPLAHELAVSALRRRGVFVQRQEIFEALPGIRRLVLDKTGTLTLEQPKLTNPDALRRLAREDRMMLWHLVAHQRHPVARALRTALLEWPESSGPKASPEVSIQETVGQGLEAKGPAATYRLGRAGWAAHERECTGEASGTRLTRDGEELATFHFADAVREDAKAEITALAQHFPVTILSGDRQEKVTAMAQALGLPSAAALGEQTPEDKAAWVQSHEPDHTLFVGDGANDSLAFDAAAVRGTPVVDRSVLEAKADFYFTGQNLRGLRALFAIGRQRARAARTVFAFSVSYNLVAVALCFAALMNPLLAAILMPLSSLVTLGLVGWIFRR